MGYLLLLRELGEQVKAAALRVATWYRARCQKGASQRGTTSRVCRPTSLPSLLSTLLKVRDLRAEEQARDVEKPTGW